MGLQDQLFQNDKNSTNVRLVFVLIDREEDKAAVKRYLDKVGVVSQFLLAKTMLDK